MLQVDNGYVQQTHHSMEGSFYCTQCTKHIYPFVGQFVKSKKRHTCRYCGGKVCSDCSQLQNNDRESRICLKCSTKLLEVQEPAPPAPREKFLFLVRHAESTWNRQVDLIKTVRHLPLEHMSVKDVMTGAAHIMVKEVWNKDHPISEEGMVQTKELRSKIQQALSMKEEGFNAFLQSRNRAGSSFEAVGENGVPEDVTEEAADELKRMNRYYETFFSGQRTVYCSPLLRALQTALLALPSERWGQIKLLKDAREHFNNTLQRDCLGIGIGEEFLERVAQMSVYLPGTYDLKSLKDRIDATDCEEQWWSDQPETQAELDSRLTTLWHRLLDEDEHDSCVLVTHSNLIKAIVMRFGGGFEGKTEASPSACRADVTLGPGQDDSHLQGCTEQLDIESSMSWQMIEGGPEALRQLKVERLQNCGVLGLRCVLEDPDQESLDNEGWVALRDNCKSGGASWVAKDGLLMFGSELVL